MSFEEFSGQKTRSELAFEAIDKNGDGYVSRSAITTNLLEGDIQI